MNGAALKRILGAHPLRQIEQRAEASFQRRIAINLAADVADDPAKSCPNLSWRRARKAKAEPTFRFYRCSARRPSS